MAHELLASEAAAASNYGEQVRPTRVATGTDGYSRCFGSQLSWTSLQPRRLTFTHAHAQNVVH
eukprot:5848643-Pleurochrysis_carterae.AAC.1